MTAAEQHQQWGACVEANDEAVILQVGKEMVALTPQQAQHFAYYLAQAYFTAGQNERTSAGTWKLRAV